MPEWSPASSKYHAHETERALIHYIHDVLHNLVIPLVSMWPCLKMIDEGRPRKHFPDRLNSLRMSDGGTPIDSSDRVNALNSYSDRIASLYPNVASASGCVSRVFICAASFPILRRTPWRAIAPSAAIGEGPCGLRNLALHESDSAVRVFSQSRASAAAPISSPGPLAIPVFIRTPKINRVLAPLRSLY